MTSTLKLDELAGRIINPELSSEETTETIKTIYEHFKDLTGVTGHEESIGKSIAINTEYGSALGLNHAALCLLDIKRTQLFLQGLVDAIRKKQAEFPEEKIKIFYAGCGPYAPFVTLVAPLFKPSEVSFSILDINSESIQFALDLIQKLGLEEYVEEHYLTDAITFKVENADQYHILFSETLDALLSRECYVPIVCNLLPQFPEGTELIPKNIHLKLTFLYKDENDNDVEGDSQLIFDAREAVASTVESGMIPEQFEAKRVPLDRSNNLYGIIMDTDVHINDELILTRDQSQLTVPFAFKVEPNVPFDTLVFTYTLKPKIELFIGTEMSAQV